ncbi:MAG TPA: hypothetical protein DEO88_08335 [Syntrophobacteraceae bacterium]|nr:hypothetical protein [Syntrophobacteraceae bacterium]
MSEERSTSNDFHVPSPAPAGWKRPEKITLIGLLSLACITIVLILLLIYVVPTYGLSRIHPRLPMILGLLTLVLAMGVMLGGGLLITVTLLGHDVPFSRKLRGVAVKGLLPVLIVTGKLVGLKREQVQHAFVAVNNDLVLAHCKNGRRPSRILLLMPHCLQDKDCSVKVTHTVENCKRCGKCAIKDLLQLSEKYHVDLAVATGGTIARRIVVEKRPDLIIAVACERDLTSGIQDTTPLPVYGIFNQRPFGPCLNTQVSIAQVEAVLADVLSERASDS